MIPNITVGQLSHSKVMWDDFDIHRVFLTIVKQNFHKILCNLKVT